MNTINIIELIIIPAIASPLPSLPFLLQFTSPIIEKINPGVDVEPQHKNETIDKMNPATANPSVLFVSFLLLQFVRYYLLLYHNFHIHCHFLQLLFHSRRKI